jgi:hypothetical protein
MQQPHGAAGPYRHFVQFYKADEPALNRNVAGFLWDGLLRGDGLLVMGTQQRRESLSSHLARLGADVALARREAQLVMLDADDLLGRFMVDGQPDWELFQAAVGEALQLARPRVPEAGISAYGELVGVLWEAGETSAAIRLEEYWNRLLHKGGISLFCGYPIDVFADEFHRTRVHDVLCAHSNLMPTSSAGDLGAALDRAMDELLGPGVDEVRSSMNAGIASPTSGMPETESAILWLRRNVPANAERILACARNHYAASLASACAEPVSG